MQLSAPPLLPPPQKKTRYALLGGGATPQPTESIRGTHVSDGGSPYPAFAAWAFNQDVEGADGLQRLSKKSGLGLSGGRQCARTDGCLSEDSLRSSYMALLESKLV